MTGVLLDTKQGVTVTQFNQALREYRAKWPGSEPTEIQVHQDMVTPELEQAADAAGVFLVVIRPGQIRVVGD